MSRSVPITMMVICFTIGILMMNSLNNEWSKTENRPYIRENMTQAFNLSVVGDTSDSGFNETYRNLSRYDKPADVTHDYGFFMSISHAVEFIKKFFTITVNIPNYMYLMFGMPYFIVTPLKIMLLINHTFAIIYLITGKSLY